MKRILLCAFILTMFVRVAVGQNVFDPLDPIVRYDAKQALGTEKHPDPSLPGLQKWVSTPTIGVSVGSDTFDNSSFKQYYINVNGKGVAFRIKYPRSYRNPDSAGKKYPIMLFLHGGGEVGCPSNGGIYNNERPIWLGGKFFRDKVDQGAFDGFLLYPQYVVTEGCFSGWLSAGSPIINSIFSMVDSMAKYARADIDRVVANGLSGGGYGCFKVASGWPQRIAKIMPTSAWGPLTSAQAMVHIPIWFATGQLDAEPSPEQAQTCVTTMKNIGANIRYTNFPDLGHNCWYQHWRLPDYVPEMLSAHKANPLVFFQHNEFCTPESVDAKLGLTGGFSQYEWQKDGALIATSQNGVNTILDAASVSKFTGNEITVKEFGTYRARFKRTASSDWSVWSPIPAVIKTKSTTQTAPIEIDGAHSKVLTALDGSTTVPLTLPADFLNYKWYRVSDNAVVDTTQKFNAPAGLYKARYDEEFGCATEFSPEFRVVDAAGEPKPNPATGLTAVPVTQTILKLDWKQQAGGASDAESGFEVYRSSTPGGPYQFVKLVKPNALTFKDSNLIANTMYYYKVRAVNGTGAAAPTSEAAVKTVSDNTAPTAPLNLTGTVQNQTSVLLKWGASTDNNAVTRYDVYVNGAKLYSTTTLQFTVTGLDGALFYKFVVTAVDDAGNTSAPSNQVTANTTGKPPVYTPGVPDVVTATALSYNSIVVSWKDTMSNEIGFEVLRSTAANGTFTNAGTVKANDTSFTDENLTASKQYFYKVRAIAATDESPYSAAVSATTEALPATPVQPTGLTAIVGGNGYVALAWKDNSANETGYQVYRSTDNTTYTLMSALPANSNGYTDETATGTTVYYYYVNGVNGAGNSPTTDTISVNAGNQAPVLHGLTDMFVRKGITGTLNFSVTDEPGDIVTVGISDKPSFITLEHPSTANYTIRATPGTDNSGTYPITITATDNQGKSSSASIVITVGNKNSTSVYINFGSANKEAAGPWNNWLGKRLAGDALSNLKDETGEASTFTVTTVTAWSDVTNLGHITGDNSGVFPDEVLQSGLSDTGSAKEIRIGGLNPAMQYNLIFGGSQNEGIPAFSTYQANGQSAILDARYNTVRTASLNNLTPDAQGGITVTVSRNNGSPTSYLNGMVIEELAASVQLPAPATLYAEAVNRTTVNLTWNDRTNNENASDGYELSHASDSLFTKQVVSISLPANTTSYSNTGLSPDTKYWYRVRAKGSSGYSEYSNAFKVITPGSMVYVNFNTTVEGSPTPWNNLNVPPLSTFTTDFLNDQSGAKTNVKMELTKEFNGEFTAGVRTGNNSGVVPDNVLGSDYWLDKNQLSQFVVKGLNHAKQYRFGFFGSSSPPVWVKGNYTATYTINGKRVYLNSWQNSTKIVYIGDVSPDDNGDVSLDFSTTPEANYGFNGGVILQEYTNTPETTDVDTLPTNPGGGVDTVVTNPGGGIDTIPTNPGGGVDTIPTNPGGGVDTIPGNPGGGIDTTPPVNGGGNPDTTISEQRTGKLKVYPNPVSGSFHVSFYNDNATNDLALEIYDPRGVLTFRRKYGQLQKGTNAVPLTIYEANLKKGLYIVTLKAGGKVIQSTKLVLINY